MKRRGIFGVRGVPRPLAATRKRPRMTGPSAGAQLEPGASLAEPTKMTLVRARAARAQASDVAVLQPVAIARSEMTSAGWISRSTIAAATTA